MNLQQLQRQRCSRLERFSKWKKIFLFEKRLLAAFFKTLAL
jgi:hypothetical protein